MTVRIDSSKIEFNAEKFKQLVLYFANECKDDEFFGSTRLNKMLFAADFFAYIELGNPITGAVYQHLRKGPAPRQLLPIRQEMETAGLIQVKSVNFHGKEQKRPVAMEKPDTDPIIVGAAGAAAISMFSYDELALCKKVVKAFCDVGAEDSSDWSHNLFGWLNTTDREEIPYYTIFLWKKEPISRSDIEWAQNKIVARTQS